MVAKSNAAKQHLAKAQVNSNLMTKKALTSVGAFFMRKIILLSLFFSHAICGNVLA